MNPVEFTSNLTTASSQVVERICHSLVVVHNGRNGVGAGIVWKKPGLIITNNHVLAGSASARVTLLGGKELPARLIAKEAEIDLALLQVDLPDLPVALVADSRFAQVGQLVLAIGHPWGEKAVVTAGIISGLSTAAVQGKRGSIPIIRSDVELAPGNSGGPLVNVIGGVLGINTLIVGGDLGVAIPSQVVNEFVSQAGKARTNVPFGRKVGYT